MTDALRAAAEQALRALESCDPGDWSTGHVIHPSYHEPAVEAAIDALRAALDAAPVAPAVPAGWRLVPVEPTPEMVVAAWGAAHDDADSEDPGTIAAWGRMLAAAPQPTPAATVKESLTAPTLDAIRAADRGMRAEDAPKLGMSMFASRADYAATAEESSAVGVPSAEPPAIPTGDVTESSFGEWQEASK